MIHELFPLDESSYAGEYRAVRRQYLDHARALGLYEGAYAESRDRYVKDTAIYTRSLL
jgi:hypothetical protein